MHLRRLGIDDADLCNGRDQSAASGDTGLVNDGGSSFRAMVNRQVRFKFSEWLPPALLYPINVGSVCTGGRSERSGILASAASLALKAFCAQDLTNPMMRDALSLRCRDFARYARAFSSRFCGKRGQHTE